VTDTIVAPVGDLAQAIHQEAGWGFVFAGRELETETGGVVDPQRSRHEMVLLAKPLDSCLADVVLIADLSDQLLDEILESDHACGPTVLVDHEGAVLVASRRMSSG